MKIISIFITLIFICNTCFAGVLFDANTEHISIADNAKWDWTPVDQNRTLSFYYRTSSIPNVDGEYQVFLSLASSGGNNSQFILLHNSGVLLLFWQVTDSSWSNLGAFYTLWTPSLDTWYHITAVASTNGNCKIYIDGAAQSVSYSSWDDNTAISVVSIFISNTVAVYDAFQIAHFAFFNDELTSDEVALYKAYPWAVRGDANLLYYAPLHEGTGTTANDFSGTATNGTLINSPTWTDDPVITKQIIGD